MQDHRGIIWAVAKKRKGSLVQNYFFIGIGGDGMGKLFHNRIYVRLFSLF